MLNIYKDGEKYIVSPNLNRVILNDLEDIKNNINKLIPSSSNSDDNDSTTGYIDSSGSVHLNDDIMLIPLSSGDLPYSLGYYGYNIYSNNTNVKFISLSGEITPSTYTAPTIVNASSYQSTVYWYDPTNLVVANYEDNITNNNLEYMYLFGQINSINSFDDYHINKNNYNKGFFYFSKITDINDINIFEMKNIWKTCMPFTAKTEEIYSIPYKGSANLTINNSNIIFKTELSGAGSTTNYNFRTVSTSMGTSTSSSNSCLNLAAARRLYIRGSLVYKLKS